MSVNGVIILFCIYKPTHFAHFSAVLFASLSVICRNIHTFSGAASVFLYYFMRASSVALSCGKC